MINATTKEPNVAKMKFLCTNCESEQVIIINNINAIYIMGTCSKCRNHIVMNRKRLGKEKDDRVAGLLQIN